MKLIFEKTLTPDYYFGAFSEITPEFLMSIGASAVISDIDNTLVPYETEEATEEIINWVKSLDASGIKTAFVSNNHASRVEKFNRPLGKPAYADVGKPGIKYLLCAVRDMNVSKDRTVFLGDQLLTDAAAAHRAGLRMIAVPPIKDKTSLFFKLKRALEKPYMKKFFKNRGKR